MANRATQKSGTEMERVGNTALAEARPAWMAEGTGEGTEHIKNDDVQMPRVLVAQGLSPQLDRTSPAYLPNLRPNEMFNTLDGRIYGEGPLQFAVVHSGPPYWMILKDRKEGGGILVPDVRADDPRTKFGPNGEKPQATKFYTYVLMLIAGDGVEPGELIVLTLKSTGVRTARKLNGLIKMRAAKKQNLYDGVYTLGTSTQKNEQGSWGVFVVENAGLIQDEQLYTQAREAFKHFQGQSLRATEQDVAQDPEGVTGHDREPGSDDDIE